MDTIGLATLASLFALIYVGILGVLNIAVLIVNMIVVVWFAAIAKRFVKLQAERAEQDLQYQAETDKEVAMTSKEILERALKKAEGIVNTISIGGSSYGPIAVAQGNNAKVTQTTEQEIFEKKDGLALLKAYCEEAKNIEASALAEKILVEADKIDPNRNIIFDSWTRIVSLLPPIGQIASIANTIRLMLG